MPGEILTSNKDLVLIVDDELIKRETTKVDFLDLIKVPAEHSLFVGSYEEALNLINSGLNIIFCFIDIRIPKNEYEQYDYDSKESDWGIELASQIKQIEMFIYSAYVDYKILQEKVRNNKLIVGSGHKPFRAEEFRDPIEHLTKTLSLERIYPTTKESLFDYTYLDRETASFLKNKTQEITQTYRRTIQGIIEIGQYLIESKERLEYGQFYKWIEAELPFGETSAIRFMQTAKKFAASNLEGLNIAPSALYKLAEASFPQEAVEVALEKARKGEKITNVLADELKSKYSKPKNKSSQVEEQESQAKSLSVSPSPQILPSKKMDRPKQEILGVVPSQNATQNSWWQLGEHNRLFCGEPKSQEFLGRLPKDIALKISFLPKDDPSLIPSLKSTSSLSFYSEYKDLDLDSLIEDYINTATRGKDIVVFNYLYYVGLLNLTESLNCYFWVAEPDLKKCERILTIWREKGSVMRIKS